MLMEEPKHLRLLTILEAAELMRVSRQTIYAWINNGKLRPVQTPGGRLRIPEEQLIVEGLRRPKKGGNEHYRVIDISDHEPLQPEWMGTKPKNWFARTDKHWYWEWEGDKFLFKSGREGTGENWAEKVASELCDLLGLPHAQYDLAVYRNMKGVITPNFVPAGATLIHGNEILARFVRKYETERRYKQRQHTLRIVYAVMCSEKVEPPLGWSRVDEVNSAVDVFVGYLMLDAWIANQDRHHENWGLISEPRERRMYLAPTFDHASSLGRNETDASRADRLHTRDVGRSLEYYISRARSAFYQTTNSARPMLTSEVFREIAMKRPVAARHWLKRLEQLSSKRVREALERVPADVMSDIAEEFTYRILDLNKKRLLGMLDRFLKGVL